MITIAMLRWTIVFFFAIFLTTSIQLKAHFLRILKTFGGKFVLQFSYYVTLYSLVFTKMSHILKQTCTLKIHICLRMWNLLVETSQ